MNDSPKTQRLPQGSKRPLARRIVLAFVVVVLALITTAIAGVLTQRRAAMDVDILSRGFLPLETNLALVRAQQWTTAAMLERLVDEPRSAGTSREWFQTDVHRRVAKLLETRDLALTVLASSRDERAVELGKDLAATAEQLANEATIDGEAILQLFGDKREQRPLLLGAIKKLSARGVHTARALDSVIQRVVSHRERALKEGQKRENQARIFWIVSASLAGMVALLASAHLYRALSPLSQLTQHAQKVAQGERRLVDPNIMPVSDVPGDEIAELAVAFSHMVSNVARSDAELIRLKERQEDIVNHLRDAIIVVNDIGRVEAANPAAEMFLGVKTSVSLSSANPELWQLVADDVRRVLFDGGEGNARLGVSLKSGPSVLVADVRVVPMRGGTSGEGLVLLVVADVSEAWAARQRALQAERLAAIGKMAAHVTHEIRNPLSSIGLNVELLEESLDDKSAVAVKLLKAIAREVERLRDISEEYLRLARLPEPKLKVVDLHLLLFEVISFVSAEFERAQIHIEAKHIDHVEAYVDESQLRQVLLNLLRNAREACEESGIIRIQLHASVSQVSLVVEDNGAGIDDSVKERIFDPYFTTKSTGTGLGLPLTKQIIEAHGGRIQCDSVHPHGTRFIIELPLQHRESESNKVNS